ncbi:hypothetical protein [Paraburkholderia nemoris]|uniref:Uncharacterized protein n=1 Tax=Paraburkholderia nemoris TaxID=2793076 RepID=A0ABN7KXL0_9BURK|nr:hypothetical protein [Paraburkholderia nemoris]MBK5148648.1 hypothetical protein [Burkholderia sp. R-69608]CAE6718745.1 hypothetical protein R69776_01453 [Paraburkholderia nemoris]CAE6721329.1 hypothetical protein R75777_01619 [Paraburkholderia nemoris]CAE6907689.1 hypothetical protein R69608_03323 [Paraburkholderia nemoris]
MKTQLVDRVETVWSSAPDEYNFVTLEVLLDRNPVVVINRENGLDKLEVELFGPTPDGTMVYKLSLDCLINALIDGRKGILESPWTGLPEGDSNK